MKLCKLKNSSLLSLMCFQLTALACPYEPNDPRSVQSIGDRYAKSWPKSGEICSIVSGLTPRVQDFLGMANEQARKCYKESLDVLPPIVRKLTNAEMTAWLNTIKLNLRQGKFGYEAGQLGYPLEVRMSTTLQEFRPAFPAQCFSVRDAMIQSVDEALSTLGTSAQANTTSKPEPRSQIAPNATANSQAAQQSSQQSQQQNQSTQQQSQQAQQQARQTQARADQARQGQRRRHEPENEASHCIQPDFGGLYGGMKNTCDFKVWYTYCGYRPKESSWLTGMSCEKQSFGSDSVSPGRTSASHTKGVESIHWIACKEPAWTVDTEFVEGQGIKGRCHTVGGK
jgi:hypothetical protein